MEHDVPLPSARTLITAALHQLSCSSKSSPAHIEPEIISPIGNLPIDIRRLLLLLDTFMPDILLDALSNLDHRRIKRYVLPSSPRLPSEHNSVYYVHPLPRGNQSRRRGRIPSYEVRTGAWSCTCSLFAHSAFGFGDESELLEKLDDYSSDEKDDEKMEDDKAKDKDEDEEMEVEESDGEVKNRNGEMTAVDVNNGPDITPRSNPQKPSPHSHQSQKENITSNTPSPQLPSGENQTSTQRPYTSQLAAITPSTLPEADNMTELRDWKFGDPTLGENLPPLCPHLMACILAECCPNLFGKYIVKKRVSVGRLAGLAVAWM